MKPATILLSVDGGARLPAEAWPCGVPGLAVTPGVPPECMTPSWTVTHVRSGAAVWRCLGSPEAALDIAQQLAQLADWTRGARELHTGVLPDILKGLGVHSHATGTPWSGADLNGQVSP